MAIVFPPSPTIGQIYTDPSTGRQWEWDGSLWNSYVPAVGAANQVIYNDGTGSPTGSANLTYTGTAFAANAAVAIGQTSAASNTDFDLNGTYAQTIVAVPALDIDCSAGNYFTKTISSTSTFTFSNVPASRAYSFTLEVTLTSGSINWPTEVKWPLDTPPTLTAGRTNLFMFVTDDGGSRWRGAALVDYVN